MSKWTHIFQTIYISSVLISFQTKSDEKLFFCEYMRMTSPNRGNLLNEVDYLVCLGIQTRSLGMLEISPIVCSFNVAFSDPVAT